MEIDLSQLHSNNEEKVDITGSYNIPKEYFTDSQVLECNNIKVYGYVYQKDGEEGEEDDYINVRIEGEVIIEDSISLEPLPYKINIFYDDILDENCKKSENSLDIFEFLWENIVLEIPLKVTKVKDLSKFQGDGWKLISEEEHANSNNPFADVLKDFKEE